MRPRRRLPPKLIPILPTEVCEIVIDHVHYSGSRLRAQAADKPRWFPPKPRTLYACSLVCSEWRPRSQRWLFYSVWLDDTKAFYALQAAFEAQPHLASYVNELVLGGILHHTPRSVVSFLPTILQRKLPSLHTIRVIRDSDAAHSDEYLRLCLLLYSTELKRLPCLPIHPWFSNLLQSTSACITKLILSSVTFPSFADLPRTLSAFPALRDLVCDELKWHVLGAVPKCLKANSSIPFLPKLEKLWLVIGAHGPERLLPALGPSLTHLTVALPNFDIKNITDDPFTGSAHALNLAHLLNLEELCIRLRVDRTEDLAVVSELFRPALRSWTSRARKKLVLAPSRYKDLTRQQFVDVLRALGPDVIFDETSPVSPAPPSEASPASSTLPTTVVVRLLDSTDRWDWWKREVSPCFTQLQGTDRLVFELHNHDPPFWGPDLHYAKVSSNKRILPVTPVPLPQERTIFKFGSPLSPYLIDEPGPKFEFENGDAESETEAAYEHDNTPEPLAMEVLSENAHQRRARRSSFSARRLSRTLKDLLRGRRDAEKELQVVGELEERS